MTNQQTIDAPPAKPARERIPVLWFDNRGCGPDHLALELHPFPAELGGRISACLGLRVRAGDLAIGAAGLIDGGFNLGREQVAALHRALGAWLDSIAPVAVADTPAGPPERAP
jgi:hypothetical protein